MDDLTQTQRWLDRLEFEGKSTRTLSMYHVEVKRLAAWVQPRELSDITGDDVFAYLLKRKRSGLGASGLTVIVNAVKSFYRSIGKPEVVANIKAPPVKAKAQRTLSEEEALQLIASIDSSTITGKRDLSLIGLMLATGLRASEVCDLSLADLNMDNRSFRVKVKGGDIANGVFDEIAAAQLDTWLTVRPRVADPESGTVFVSVNGGGKLTRVGIKLLCKRLAVKAGLRHFSPHALRRTFATLAIDNGCPTRLLMEAGRWKSLAVVEVYTRNIQLKKFEKFSPLANLLKGDDNRGS